MMLSWSCSNNIKGFFLVLFVSLLVTEPILSVSTERCHSKEKKVLLNIKKAFNGSTLNGSWLPNTDCCDWESIYCHGPDDYHVVNLFIFNADFTGPIPDAIADLTHLASLTLSNITGLSPGPIPFFITKLRNLQNLEISNCNRKGNIPGFLSKLRNLQALDLSSNKLKGNIPSFLSDISGLNNIKLSGNRLTGTIPESLVKLKAHDFPSLILSHNKLSGEIPPSFGAINFDHVDFSYNRLRGDISMLFGRNKTTSYMKFARNKFEFNMSQLQLNPMLTELDISRNNIYGSLPREMINMRWDSLNVSYNRLCGPIPQGGNLQTNFGYTSFFHNHCLCGAPLTVTCN